MIETAFLQWVTDTDTVILLCWDLGHIWNASIYANIETGPHGEHLLTGYCERECGVKRVRYLSSTWSPESNKNTYAYPPGYSPRGVIRDGFFMDREHKALIRRELGRRVQEETELDYAASKRKAAKLAG